MCLMIINQFNTDLKLKVLLTLIYNKLQTCKIGISKKEIEILLKQKKKCQLLYKKLFIPYKKSKIEQKIQNKIKQCGIMLLLILITLKIMELCFTFLVLNAKRRLFKIMKILILVKNVIKMFKPKLDMFYLVLKFKILLDLFLLRHLMKQDKF